MKSTYRTLCARESTIPIFSRDWWLDAACGEAGWDVALVERGGEVLAAMPYHLLRGRRFAYVAQPGLTQTLGPWLRPSQAKYAKALGQQKDLLEELIRQLPPFDHFLQNWHHSQTNWLPFYWHGFTQTTRYTYILPDLTDLDRLWAGFQEGVRTDIRKATGRFGLKVRTDLPLDAFLRLNRLTFERQGLAPPHPEALIRRLDEACALRGQRRCWIAEDSEGRHHAGAYVVWDEQSAYYLIGGADPELRNSGAMSLCAWEAIRHAATVTRSFDFEGSMLEPVERFFRAFGAVQTPYFTITKTPNRLVQVRHFLRELRGGGR